MRIWLIAHAFILDEQGKLLLTRRSADNDVLPLVWDIPGGSCEPGEDPLAAAQRETQEETGLHIDQLQLFAHTSNVDATKDTQFVRCVFLAQVQRQAVVLNPEEHDAYAWVDLDRIEQDPLVDYLPRLIDMYTERHASV